jgi:membrane associated rhomboid family serine protease
MPYTSRSRVSRYSPSNRFPVGLKWLLIVNVGIFVLSYILVRVNSVQVALANLRLVPSDVVHGRVWELVTYMFLHDGISHILWNMLALWMFGVQVERLWGTTRFLRFYFLCGIFAGLTVVAAAYIFSGRDIGTVGSSGAIYGLLMAFALMFPDSTILFGFLIPMKSKYFVMIIGGIILLESYMATIGKQPGTGVAVMAHLGGLVAGYLLLRGSKLRVQIRQPAVAAYKDWKLRRAKKKFEVYLRKQNSDRDRRVH